MVLPVDELTLSEIASLMSQVVYWDKNVAYKQMYTNICRSKSIEQYEMLNESLCLNPPEILQVEYNLAELIEHLYNISDKVKEEREYYTSEEYKREILEDYLRHHYNGKPLREWLEEIDNDIYKQHKQEVEDNLSTLRQLGKIMTTYNINDLNELEEIIKRGR